MSYSNEIQRALTVTERIRDSYTFLQASIFFELIAKTKMKNVPEDIEENDPPFDINFDTGNSYRLRNDYIVRALRIAGDNPKGLSLISQIALIQSFTEIITKTSELLDTGNAGSPTFKSYCKSKLGQHYQHFHLVIKFFRNIFVHSISHDYKLKKKDFSAWKDRIPAGWTEVRLNVTITHSPPAALDIRIVLDNVIEGMSVWDVIGTGAMLNLIELVMNLCYEFERLNTRADPTDSEAG